MNKAYISSLPFALGSIAVKKSRGKRVVGGELITILAKIIITDQNEFDI